MCMKEGFGGELWWTLNLVVRGVGDVLMSPLRHMECDYGRILGGVGGKSPAILDLRWEMAPRLASGMICVAKNWPFRKPFQIYMASPVQMMLHMRLTWRFRVVPINEM
jgi:hypothetical protein